MQIGSNPPWLTGNSPDDVNGRWHMM